MRRPPCPATTTDNDGTRVACIKPRWHWGRLYGRAHDSGAGRVRVIWARDPSAWLRIDVSGMEPIEWGENR